jgi:hypothetical protein
MIIEQIIKTLNCTELLLKGTNEYMAQCRKLNCLKDWHNDADDQHKINFVDKQTRNVVEFNIYYKGQIRTTNGPRNKENRITGRRSYFKELKDLNPGDEILFERITTENENKEMYSTYFVDVKKNNSLITFQKSGQALEILNQERLTNYLEHYGTIHSVYYKGELMNFEIIFIDVNHCRLQFTKADQTIFLIETINDRNLLKFDFNDMKLKEIDPLSYCRLELQRTL